MLAEALGNPEHRGRVRGVSSRHSWKKLDSWQSDANSGVNTRQRYKEGLIQQGGDEAMKEVIMGTIHEAFTSNDSKMVELRMQIFVQASVLPSSGTSQAQWYPADENIKQTLGIL